MITRLLQYLNINNELEDFEQIHQNIEKDVIFKGTNLWILVFAIIVASIGLNMNSTAVIIGAMLISPLMGPINAMGYSMATYNFPLFNKAIKNFGFAVGASIVASAAYFFISPVSTAHSELLARTSPTIYDVLIALFGGLAGIVANCSRHKGNVIPGVAIATALMPPLCTAGYGLATAQFTYFFGAFYLFFINTVFIAISAAITSQFLKFPISSNVKQSVKAKVKRLGTAVIVITIVPSIYFGYLLVQKEKFIKNAAVFTESISVYEGNFLLKKEINPDKKEITLIYGGNSFTEFHKEAIKDKAKIFSLGNIKLDIQQGFSIGDLAGSFTEIDNLKNGIAQLTSQLKAKDRIQDSISNSLRMGKQLLAEIKPLFPQIKSCSFVESFLFNDSTDFPEKISVVIFSADKKSLKPEEKERINLWLNTRLNKNNIKAYFEDKKLH
jgi:uncharacterized hydrophobic protein (TIGR00271 family)